MREKKIVSRIVAVALALIIGATVGSISDEVNAAINEEYITDVWTHEVSEIPRAHMQIIDGDTLRVTLHKKEHEDTHSMKLRVGKQQIVVPFDGDIAVGEIDLSQVDFESIDVYEVGAKEYGKYYEMYVGKQDNTYYISCNGIWDRGSKINKYAVKKMKWMNKNLNPKDYIDISYYELYSYEGRDTYGERKDSLRIMSKVKKTAIEITKDCKNDTQKAMAIYEWLGKNIVHCQYDITSGEILPLPRDGQAGYYTYDYGLGVCNGIAMLYEDMLRYAGIPAVRVTGYVTGFGNHAWTAIYLEGEWRLSDATVPVPTYVMTEEKKESEWNRKNMYEKYEAFCIDPQVFSIKIADPWNVDKPNKIKTSGKGTYVITGNNTVDYYGPVSLSSKKVTVPKTTVIDGKKYKVTGISKSAFVYMKKLKYVTIGKNVTEIGNYAFEGCEALRKVIITGTKVKNVGKSTFKYLPDKAVVKVPKKAYKKYKRMLVDTRVEII